MKLLSRPIASRSIVALERLSDHSIGSTELGEEERSKAWFEQEKEWIAEFFAIKVPKALAKSGKGVSESLTSDNCLEYAQRLLGATDIEPVENQGATSYTLVCLSQEKIIQFRLEALNEDVLTLAQAIYGNLVPTNTFFGDFALPVYVSPLIPGKVHILQHFPKHAFPLRRQLKTITELAQFVAKSAFWPQPASTYSSTSWTKTARHVLEKLAKNTSLGDIEPRFLVKASILLEKVYLLDKLPPVLTHHDFVEINIIVDVEGRVNGVIDFDEAQSEAFGFCIFGIYESFLGHMKDSKWIFFDEQAGDESGRSVKNVLESAFWDTLWESLPSAMAKRDYQEAITVAMDIGSINRYLVPDLLEKVDITNDSHLRSLEFARGMLLDR
ncbi:Protein kinase-like (PK-like) [Glarea lozoyensis ATCC 20868]|uniref:Protein kinase-like (PK-like) n=1 Tax=Glarea lozoyensis (strain ATCC 20868 / MF5171) TaxID=1116229 RepID=S3CX81_GLAL2|nr:Protein kinase-like (PK-like) [Glarea lozoyensis ATCC 20868]EPE29539.1 Protein kinase-like (PK-like) [Glarea lozoyensis ATCC 20868]